MCGIFVVYSRNKSNNVINVINNLKLLQHRGKDGCGISYINNKNQSSYKVLEKEEMYLINMKMMKLIFVLITGYSTSGRSMKKNIKKNDKQNELQTSIGENSNKIK